MIWLPILLVIIMIVFLQFITLSLLSVNLTSSFFFFSSRRRHTSWNCDWSSDVCSSDLRDGIVQGGRIHVEAGGHVDARLPPGSAAGERREEGAARRRPQSAGIHRRDSRAARTAGDLPARRTHSRR